jgi:endonuclease-3
MKPELRQQMFERLRARNPQPTTELEYSTPFELLVAVILSAQATDKGVNVATRKLFPVADTPAAILALGEAGLVDSVKTIGLYRGKARNIIATCKLLLEQHDGAVPHDRDALEALPGVGQKTADVVLNEAFGHPSIAVDTHVFRVARRLGLSRSTTPQAVSTDLLRCIPKAFQRYAHHWLILHGRYTCTARTPKCPTCPIAHLCHAPDNANLC